MERSNIQVQLQLKSSWSVRHGHWAEAELPFDPKDYKAIFEFNGQILEGIKLWGSVEGSQPGHRIYRWGIRTRFALTHLFTWQDTHRWNLEFEPIEPQHSVRNFYSKGSDMARVEATPEEIERFAQTLKQFTGQLQSSMKQLKGAQSRLGESWRDQENAKYAQEFDQALRVLERFIVASEQQAPFLQRKAQRLRDFIQQR